MAVGEAAENVGPVRKQFRARKPLAFAAPHAVASGRDLTNQMSRPWGDDTT